jgi:dephospho-CoA kinase
MSEGKIMNTSSMPSALSATELPIYMIGILGGVASGKSVVAEILAEHGLGILDADRAGHETLRLSHVVKAARNRWGEKVLAPNGQIDRNRLAEIVFTPGEEAERERKYLEGLTHPEIAFRLMLEANRMTASGVPAVVLDAAVMIEAGWDVWCDKLVFVEVPRKIRLERALARGWKEADFIAREGVQESLDFKRRRADVVIDNSGSTEQARAQVERFLPSLLRRFPPQDTI